MGEVKPIGTIDRDVAYERDYIPVCDGWEIQTKGKGSTFRISDHTNDKHGRRLPIPDSPYLHDTLERMARAIHADRVALEAERDALRAEVGRLRVMVPAKQLLERDCLTLNDWKYRAHYLESQWANCSHTCAVIQGRAERAEAEADASETELRIRTESCAEAREKVEQLLVEVAKLTAACAQMREALDRCAGWFGAPSPHFDDRESLAYAIHTARSTDAGKGWIDATVAVEADASFCSPGICCALVPETMAGKRVLIVKVGP